MDNAQPLPTEDNRRCPGLRILLVEDHVVTAETMATLLRTYGHEVQVALDGVDALRAAEAEPPDVVLLDIGLPGISGYQVAHQIRQQRTAKRPLLIALTGYGKNSEDRLQSYEVGIDLHLTKPVAVDELQQFLERYQNVRKATP
ncbi:MAG TPA: response regulator [Gemmataceae bacterium]|nr:response regulator [Gemmataceae bacterium]